MPKSKKKNKPSIKKSTSRRKYMSSKWSMSRKGLSLGRGLSQNRYLRRGPRKGSGLKLFRSDSDIGKCPTLTKVYDDVQIKKNCKHRNR